MSARRRPWWALVLAVTTIVLLAAALPAAAHAGWRTVERVVPGRFADAEIFRLPDGRYRMLYGTESEFSGPIGIYSSISSDGKTWRTEGIVLAGHFSGPDVARLPDGGYRLYLQGEAMIGTEPGATVFHGVVSYVSSDGATWTPEPGVRLPEQWLAPGESYGFSSTTRRADGTWVMAYAVEKRGRYARGVPTGLGTVHWATSDDGLTFTRRGVAFTSRTRTLYGNARSPEFLGRHLYFWSLAGIFRVPFTGTSFGARPESILPSCKHPTSSFPWFPPPSDPTLIRIGGRPALFHGDHTRGIHGAIQRPGPSRCFRGHI